MWFNPGGTEMGDDEWGTHFVKALVLRLSGHAADIRDYRGQPILDDTFLLLLNAGPDAIQFKIPGSDDQVWETVLNTRDEAGFVPPGQTTVSGQIFEMIDRSFAVLKRR
jgi:glycogen operon protein